MAGWKKGWEHIIGLNKKEAKKALEEKKTATYEAIEEEKKKLDYANMRDALEELKKASVAPKDPSGFYGLARSSFPTSGSSYGTVSFSFPASYRLKTGEEIPVDKPIEYTWDGITSPKDNVEITNITAPAPIIGEAVSGRAYEVRKELKEVVGDIQHRTFDMAELLSEAAREGLYEDWGYGSIFEYSEEELGIKSSKTRYLIKIVNTCNTLGVTREVYERAGVSKLREITTLDPDGYYNNPETKTNEPLSMHIVRLINGAPGMTVDQIAYEVLKLKGLNEEDEMIVRSFSVSQETWDKVLKPALELARMKLGSAGRDVDGTGKEYSDGVCYEMLAADFLADPNNYPATGVSSWYVRMLDKKKEEEELDRKAYNNLMEITDSYGNVTYESIT